MLRYSSIVIIAELSELNQAIGNGGSEFIANVHEQTVQLSTRLHLILGIDSPSSFTYILLLDLVFCTVLAKIYVTVRISSKQRPPA